MRRPVLIWFGLLFLASGGVVVWAAFKLAERGKTPSAESVAEVDRPPGSDAPLLDEFTLTERSGEPFSSHDLDGKVWVASFFFASCPGSCRSQNLELMTLHNEYAKKGVKFVSITCDPKTDTPGKLREYADTFQAIPDAWFFLTGDLQYIRRVGTEIFRVWVDERGHMDRFMVVDKWGNVRGHFDWHDKNRLAELKTMLELLMVESAEPADVAPVMGTSHAKRETRDESPGEPSVDAE